MFMTFDQIILRIKRGNSPLTRALRHCARALGRPQGPRLPGAFRSTLRFLYEGHFLVIQVARALVTAFYRHPLFQGRCASIGRNVSIDGLPFVSGHVEIHIGNDVWLGGRIAISSGRFLDNPRLIIGDRAEISWNVQLTVNSSIVIEEDARISYDCRISDSDGHARQADLRAQNAPLNPKDIRPVRICKNAWIGNGSHIMKGVTIGEGAIIGANSVVISDIPPYSLAFGNPAEVYFKNFGRPSRPPADSLRT